MSATLGMVHSVINLNEKGSLHGGLSELTDADFNGENGEEYACEKARAEGFECDLDYYYNKAKNKYVADHKAIISYVLNKCYEHHYYSDFNYHIVNMNDNQICVVVAYMVE